MGLEGGQSIDEIISQLNNNEIIRGNKGDRVDLENGDSYKLDPETSNLRYTFDDGYSLHAEVLDGRIQNAIVLDLEGNPLQTITDKQSIAHRIASAQTVLNKVGL